MEFVDVFMISVQTPCFHISYVSVVSAFRWKDAYKMHMVHMFHIQQRMILHLSWRCIVSKQFENPIWNDASVTLILHFDIVHHWKCMLVSSDDMTFIPDYVKLV
jgi:hypothetical protein